MTLKADPAAPLAAQVFKTRIDPFVQRLSFIRVYSGTIKKDATLACPGHRKGIKIGPLLAVQADKTSPVDEAGPGEIVAVAKNEELHTGMSLGEVELPPLKFPTPMVGLAVTPKARGDETKLSGALHKITEEDSTVHLQHDAETKEMVLTGMSELHLMLLRERLKRRDKVEVDTKEPKIPYRETIQQDAEGSYRHKKQSGGSGQFGEVHIRMYPFPEGTKPEEFAIKERFPHLKAQHYHEKNHFLWVDTVVGGTIPGNFMPAIEKGFLEKIASGVVAGYPVQNICVEVHFGKDHPVDSNETAFRIAARQAFAKVFKEARPSLLGADRAAGDHGAGGQRGRRVERPLGPPRPDGRHGLGRRRHDDRRSHRPLGRGDDLRPYALVDDRRPGQLHDGIRPLRRGPRQRPAADHLAGEDQGRGRVTTAAEAAEMGATQLSSVGRRPRNPWIAAGLTLFVGTTGLVYCGHLRRAVLWEIGEFFLLIAMGCLLLYLPNGRVAWIATALLTLSINLGLIADTIRIAR